MTSGTNRWLALLAALTVVAGLSLADGFNIGTNLLDLLPTQHQSRLQSLASERVANEQSSKVTIYVSAQTEDVLSSKIEDLEQTIDNSGVLFRNNFFHDQEASVNLYKNFSHQFFSVADQVILESDPESLLNTSIADFFNPFNPISPEEYANDPALLLRRFMLSQAIKSDYLHIKDGRIWSESNGNPGILIPLNLINAAYSLDVQKQLIEFLSVLRVKWPELQFSYTGLAIHAAKGASRAQSEISTIGVGSLLGIILLITYVFRSTRPLVLVVFSISLGILFASFVTELVFGVIHVFALVFGACLTGVAVDYSFHYLTKQHLAIPRKTPHEILRAIVPAITLGLLTSVIAYLALAVTPFPGLQQVAIFSVTGLSCAFLSVLLFYPDLSPEPAQPARHLFWAHSALLGFWVKRSLQVRLLMTGTAFLALLPALVFLAPDDSIRKLQPLDPELVVMEDTIRKATGFSPSLRYFIVEGSNQDDVLQKERSLISAVTAIEPDAILHSVSNYVRPRAEQLQSYSLYQKQILPRYQDYLSRAGFNQAYTDAKYSELQSEAFRPLLLDDWINSQSSNNWRFLWLENAMNGRSASIVLLDSRKPTEYFSQLKELKLVDKADEYTKIFTLYRERVSVMLLIGYALIFLLLHFRYSWRKALLVVSVPGIAAATTLAALSIFGIGINMFHILALILVTGIGIDYSLFFAESRGSPTPTLLAIAMSSATTLLSFGLLALSSTPAVQAIGVCVCIGITVSYLIAPVAYAGEVRT